MADKPNKDQYMEWLNKRFGVNIDQRTKNHYILATGDLKTNVAKSEIWQHIIKNWNNYNDTYYKEHNYKLFVYPEPPIIDDKKYDSFFDKTYRKNVLQNPNWNKNEPENEPEGGWILPRNWFSKINDVIRTTIVVKYLDGIDFIITEIMKICETKGIHDIKPEYKASEEGYYAVHIYIPFEYNIPDFKLESKTRRIYFEIQITTQLQEVMKRLLHNYYEKRRLRDIEDLKIINENWQWHPENEEFAPSYLGHILHYVEGMIMEIRDKTRKT
jgi:hypothetical protein